VPAGFTACCGKLRAPASCAAAEDPPPPGRREPRAGEEGRLGSWRSAMSSAPAPCCRRSAGWERRRGEGSSGGRRGEGGRAQRQREGRGGAGGGMEGKGWRGRRESDGRGCICASTVGEEIFALWRPLGKLPNASPHSA
jgi:hypothetical protein